MAIRRQVIIMSVVFDDEETHAQSAAEAISHSLHNEEGIIDWDYTVKKEGTLTAELTDEEKKY